MKKTSITITWEEDKLSALRLYLAEKDIQVEDALTKALESLYAKAVPQPVQRYLDLRSGTAESAAPPKSKPDTKPKQSPPTSEKEVTSIGKPGDRPLAG